ncbi:hypothetical protein OFN94_40375, partial [Escherichia coli]|nr:hypothetical protein [Escherichia coli]
PAPQPLLGDLERLAAAGAAGRAALARRRAVRAGVLGGDARGLPPLPGPDPTPRPAPPLARAARGSTAGPGERGRPAPAAGA